MNNLRGRVDVFYFTRHNLTCHDVDKVAQSVGAESTILEQTRFLSIGFPTCGASEWHCLNPSDRAHMSPLERDALLVLLRFRARRGIVGTVQSRDFEVAGRFLAGLLRHFGGFVGFDNEGFEPIYLPDKADELAEFFSSLSRGVS